MKRKVSISLSGLFTPTSVVTSQLVLFLIRFFAFFTNFTFFTLSCLATKHVIIEVIFLLVWLTKVILLLVLVTKGVREQRKEMRYFDEAHNSPSSLQSLQAPR